MAYNSIWLVDDYWSDMCVRWALSGLVASAHNVFNFVPHYNLRNPLTWIVKDIASHKHSHTHVYIIHAVHTNTQVPNSSTFQRHSERRKFTVVLYSY